MAKRHVDQRAPAGERTGSVDIGHNADDGCLPDGLLAIPEGNLATDHVGCSEQRPRSPLVDHRDAARHRVARIPRAAVCNGNAEGPDQI